MQILLLGTLCYDGTEDTIQVATSMSTADSRYLSSIAIIERPGWTITMQSGALAIIAAVQATMCLASAMSVKDDSIMDNRECVGTKVCLTSTLSPCVHQEMHTIPGHTSCPQQRAKQ